MGNGENACDLLCAEAKKIAAETLDLSPRKRNIYLRLEFIEQDLLPVPVEEGMRENAIDFDHFWQECFFHIHLQGSILDYVIRDRLSDQEKIDEKLIFFSDLYTLVGKKNRENIMTEKENGNEIYAKLRSMRRARGLSINEFADKIGEDYQKVGRIERGKRALTIDCFVKMARALEAPVEAFLDEEASQQEAPQGEMIRQIVLAVETLQMDSKAKGDFVAKIYQLAQQFTMPLRQSFLTHFFDGLSAYMEATSNNSPTVV